MKIIGTLLAILLFLIIIAGIGYGAYYSYTYLFSKWAILRTEWQAAILIISSILTGCTIIIIASIRSLSRKLKITAPGKTSVYSDFVVWYAGLKDKPIIGDFNIVTIKEIRPHMLLWANDAVVRQYTCLYDTMCKDVFEPGAVISKADLVYLEIRRDLGYRGMCPDRKF